MTLSVFVLESIDSGDWLRRPDIGGVAPTLEGCHGGGDDRTQGELAKIAVYLDHSDAGRPE